MIRKAKAVWQGTGKDGTGHLTSDSGVLRQNENNNVMIHVVIYSSNHHGDYVIETLGNTD